jgi:hypothetical protein
VPLIDEYRDLLISDYNRLEPNGQLKDEAEDLANEVRRWSVEAGFYGAEMPESVSGRDINTLGLI